MPELMTATQDPHDDHAATTIQGLAREPETRGRGHLVPPRSPPHRRGGRGVHLELSALVAVGAAFLLLVTEPSAARAENRGALPAPLRIEDVVRLARTGRAEVVAAGQRARAAEFRPAQVSALGDPMVTASVDHLPFSWVGVDRSLMIEQEFPLSRIRRHRKRAAEALARQARADAGRVVLDVELEAVAALLMLHEARRTREIVASQQQLARQLVAAAVSRYGASQGSRPDVLRAETELARLTAEERALGSDIAAAQAMLRASLGRPAGEPIPAVAVAIELGEPPPLEPELRGARSRRPEISAMRAGIDGAAADVDVMRSMYAPMARLGVGTAYTMADGYGAMFIVGLSIPIWRGRLSAGLSEASAMQRMATADLRAMERMVEGEVAGAHEAVRAGLARVRAAREEVLPRAHQTVESALASYGAGQASMVTVLDATQTLWDTELALVQSEVNLELARARLRRATAAVGKVGP